MLARAALTPGHLNLNLAHRLATATTAIVGILALASYHPGGWGFGLAMSGILLLAHWVSYRRQGHRDRRMVALLALAMLGALFGSLQLFWSGALDSPATVANVFVALGVIQSFYLPQRKDVEDALVAPILTIIAAAAYSRDLGLAPFLLAFVASLLLSLALGHVQERYEATASPPSSSAHPYWLGALLPTATLVLGLGALAFLVTPRNLELWRQRYPASAPQPRQQDLGGAIFNPAYPNAATAPSTQEFGTAAPDPFNPEGYYGLSARLNLNYRGRLSSEVVMQVRSAESAYWRGLIFDRYTGEAWEISETSTVPLPLRDGYVNVPPALDSGAAFGNFVKLTQSFYLLRPSANTIFAAYQPVEIYFPATPVYFDRYGSLRAPEPLAEGTVYTAVSYRRRWTPDELRATRMLYPEHIQRYLALPSVPDRVTELAQRITAPYDNPYDKTMAVYDYLINGLAYDLGVPPQPPGRDTVDWFLFDEQAGYCEHFATTMAVLLRAVGIPTRLVTGYAPGTYNPFTGYYEVRGSDAHAWTDVFFYGQGWVAFDPTPGQPFAERPGERRLFILGDMAPYLNSEWGLGSWLRAIASGLSWFGPGAAGAVIMLALAWVGLRWRRGLPGRQARRMAQAEPRAQILALYDDACRALSRRGLTRHPAATPAEFLARVSQTHYTLPSLDTLTQLRYRAAYSLSPMGHREVTQARLAVSWIKESLRHQNRGGG